MALFFLFLFCVLFGSSLLLALVFIIVIWLPPGRMDHDRIKQYIEAHGGMVLNSKWSPRGPGWFDEKINRIYDVRYLDKDGNEHEARCETSMWTGVHFTVNRIVRGTEPPAPTPTPAERALEAENRQLREELERLRRP